MNRALVILLFFFLFSAFLAFSPFQMAQALNDDEKTESSPPQKKHRINPPEENSQVNQENQKRANSLGNLSIFPDELLHDIFDSLIPGHSTIARVSQLFRLLAYNAPYWKDLCKKGGLNLAEANGTPAFLYLKSQAHHKPEVAIRWAPHLERFPFTESDKERNAVAFALYKKVAKEGASEDLKALAHLHMAWMRIQGYTEAISLPEAFQILQDESKIHAKQESLIEEQNPYLTDEEIEEKSYQKLKDRKDLFFCLIAILNSKGYDKEFPFNYNKFQFETLFEHLQRTMENQKLPRQIRKYAKYLIARAIAEEIDEEGGEFYGFFPQDMVKAFINISLHYPQEALMARFLAAKLRALYYVSSQDFSDEKSSKALKEIIERGEDLRTISCLPITLKEVKYLLAKMCVEERTDEISDDMTLMFLNESNTYDAQILKAVLRAESRISSESLSDEKAAEILTEYFIDIADEYNNVTDINDYTDLTRLVCYSERWSVPFSYINIVQLMMFGQRRTQIDQKIVSNHVKTYQDILFRAFPCP